MPEPTTKKNIAIVGTGISGLSAAWTLAREGHAVTLFESEDRLGGHSLTYPGDAKTNRPPVDLGFQVFNLTTYFYLTEFFHLLNVEHEPSDMSFALSVDGGRVEWSSLGGLGGIFAQRSNMISPSFLRMMREVKRFGHEAPDVLAPANAKQFKNMTLGAYLDANGYSDRFRKEYILPTMAAVWSVPNTQMSEFPVIPLVAFMANHHLLNPLGNRPRWRVVTGRSKTYVQAIEEQLFSMGAQVYLNARVSAVIKKSPSSTQVDVVFGNDDSTETFDLVVMACHSDTTANLLQGEGCVADKALVERVHYQPNEVVLHSDESQMPVLKDAWASWNVLDKSNTDGESDDRSICVTYWLNHLQNLPASAPLLLCTLNSISTIDPSKVIFRTTLDHPIFTADAMDAQREINELQADVKANRDRNIWFAGAWLGSGFHEDGIRSAVAVATGLSHNGITPPAWAARIGAPAQPALTLMRGPSPIKTRTQKLGLKVFVSLSRRGILRGYFKMTLPDGNDHIFGRSSVQEANENNEPIVLMRVYDLAMLWKTVSRADIGLGEAYRAGMFEVNDLTAFFRLLILNSQSLRDALNPMGLSMSSPLLGAIATATHAVGSALSHLHHLARDNTVAGSRKNIEEHYDLGNKMYKLFLDDSMTYSCGIHRVEYGANPKDIPEGETYLPQYEAQMTKLDEIIRRADLQPSDHVLEIGCGWGSFAIRAASTIGCSVTGITISTEQLAEAKERVKAAGLEDKVKLIICDYRKMGVEQYNATKDQIVFENDLAPGCFDKVVSIEMLEAVGHNHLPEYFETVERMLKPQGKAVIQVISIHDKAYAKYCATSDFIRKFVFPGGHLPSLGAIKWASQSTALSLDEVVDIGPDYAITLDLWQERFRENKTEIMALGYPESWFRVWDMYFSYCSAGFTEKYIMDYHLTFVNQVGSTSVPSTSTSPSSTSSTNNNMQWLLSLFVVAFAWLASASFPIPYVAKQTASVVGAGTAFGCVYAISMPKLDPLMSTVSRRVKRRSETVMVKLCVSVLVCAVVVGLIAFHDVLYTTQLANATPWKSTAVPVAVGNAVEQQLNALNKGNASSMLDDNIYFCSSWSEEDGCGSVSQDKNEQEKEGLATKYFMRSPLHFVVAVLAWASLSRFTMHMSMLNAMHATALFTLSVLSHAADTKTATTALGLAIVHGVSELHACFRYSRTLLKLRGYTLGHQWYAHLWRLDVVAMLVIRWLPVPILLSPVILKAPWKVLLPICCIAVRETILLFQTLLELKQEIDNKANTDALLVQARSQDELIKTMAGDDCKEGGKKTDDAYSSVQNSKASSNQVGGSHIYNGMVLHHRYKVEGVTPAAHGFRYKVWMALVDLDEVRRGVAFENNRIISADGSWNLFSWHREDYYTDKNKAKDDKEEEEEGDQQQPGHTRGVKCQRQVDGEVEQQQQPGGNQIGEDADSDRLDNCIRRLVHKEIGRSLSGRVLLLTNLRCFGFVFNPVSVYYCLTEAGDALDAVVLEVSNTPWLEKRMYVLDMAKEWGKDGNKEDVATDVNRWFRSKWKKDFHVSPFFDVFYNYDWSLTMPGLDGQLRIKAVSTRRSKDAEEGLKKSQWEHTVGTGPVTRVSTDTYNMEKKKNKSTKSGVNKEESEQVEVKGVNEVDVVKEKEKEINEEIVGVEKKKKKHNNNDEEAKDADEEMNNDGPRTLSVGLHLHRSESPLAQLFGQPLMTASVVLYIHVHAVLLVFKGAKMKRKPSNAPKLGLMDAARHIVVFTVAGLGMLWNAILWPVRKLKGIVGL